MPPADPTDRSRFESVFETHHRRLLAYALRRTRNSADAEDVIAETFTIAWRRLPDLPPGNGALPWLYAVAHRVLANQRRATERRFRLIRRATPPEASPFDPDSAEPGVALSALARLRPDDRELLQLVAWDELSHGEIATVFGITPNAVAIRLHRARARFAEEFYALAGDDMKGLDRPRTYTSRKGSYPDHPPEEHTG
jgi:RNA polymerase sigma-70 factor (ECF subfamily)